MSAEQPFVHLHVHTEFSLLDGLSKIDKLVGRASELGMKHLAITDHGAMFGVVQFYRACQKAGVKPIIGMEGYLAKSDMHVHDQSERQPYHMLLLAKDQTGYKNLLKIASAAQLEGFYSKPRIDKDFLAKEKHTEGIIATSGCLAAEIPRMVADGREDEARKTIGMYQDMFGKDNFFLELQSHNIPELRALNTWLLDNRHHANVPLVATNDVHYILDSDFNAHDTLLCIQTGALKSETKRMKMTDASYHLRSQQEMWDLFGGIAPEALTNTVRVAEMCNVSLDSKGYHLPVFPVPEGYTPDSYLRYLAERGLRWRYGSEADSEATRHRLNYELSVIHQMGFDTYFLIVWDLCQFARSADIWWNVRGSGAGSVVAYTLGITNIDPLKNNLIFERFLNPGRVSMPDIDMDFPDDRRMEMIDYAMRKYGSDKVAAIITFGTLKARAAIKDVGRVLDYPLPSVNNLTKLVPQIPSKPVTLADCLGDDVDKAVPELKKIYHDDSTVKTLLDTAMTVEGVARNAGTHAAGVIIGDKPLVEYLPLHRPIGDTRVSQVTQFPMEICESIGLLKVDFLGLSTLTIMRKACDLIKQHQGIHYTLANIPYLPDPDDPEESARIEKAFRFICQGETTGIFQLESSGMTRMLVEMKPRTFEHIIAAIALFRPGPMELIPAYIRRMHGKEEVKYHHPKLEPILQETYGICVYQEQIQQIAAQLFGYSLGDADLMRRAVSKKKVKDLMIHKQTFIEKGPENGVSPEIAEKIFDEIEYFAAYGFNKSHAADYAVLTCQTAYLKAHFPEEYYTALLSVQRDVIEDVRLFTADCRRFGIPILPPNISRSSLDFSIEPIDESTDTQPTNGKSTSDDGQATPKRGIRYGLGAVKNAGAKAVQHIVDARIADGTFADLSDFCRRVDLRQVGKRALESLIKVGAFDDFAGRDELLGSLDRLIKFSTDHHRATDVGQMSLFGGNDAAAGDSLVLAPVPTGKDTSQREQLRWEKELIGLYVSEHPLNAKMNLIKHLPNIQYSESLRRAADHMNGRAVTIAGLVVAVRPITTKKGDTMAVVTLEDVEGNIDCVLFPRTWERSREMVVADQLIVVRGTADSSRGDMQIIGENVSQDFTFISSASQPEEDDPWFDPMPASPVGQSGQFTPITVSEDDALDSRDLDEPEDPEEEPEFRVSDEPPAERVEGPTASEPAQAKAAEAPIQQIQQETPRQETQQTPLAQHQPQGSPLPVPENPFAGLVSPPEPGPAKSDVVRQAEDIVQTAVLEDLYDDSEESADSELAARRITITIQRSDDADKDRRRIIRIKDRLNSYPGPDQFRFRVVDPAKVWLIDFPNHSTRYAEVESFLLAQVGPDAILIEPLLESSDS